MATNTTNNRTLPQNVDQKLIDGLDKHSGTLPDLLIGGKSYKVADIVAILQQRIAAGNLAISTRATWQNAVAADRAERANTKAFVSSLRQALLIAFGNAVDTLADFGLTPRKKAAVKPETRVAAAAKAKATRAARHTLGPKARLEIKGDPSAPAASPPNAAGSGATTTLATAAATPGAPAASPVAVYITTTAPASTPGAASVAPTIATSVSAPRPQL